MACVLPWPTSQRPPSRAAARRTAFFCAAGEENYVLCRLDRNEDVLVVERPEVRKSVGPSSLASRLIGLCARNRRWSSWRQLGDLHPRVSRRLSCFVAPGALIWACLLSVGHGHYGGCGCCDEGRRFCWSSLVGMGSGWMAPTCSAPRAEAGGADGQIPLRYLGAEQARNGGVRREGSPPCRGTWRGNAPLGQLWPLGH